MSDYGAMWGAQLVANELRAQGWMQQRRHNQDLNEYAINNALLAQQNDELVGRYTQLVGDYNELRRRAIGVVKKSDAKTATIAQLQQAKADLEAECERLRFRLLDVTTELAVLRQLDKQNHPEAYGPD